ncbi:MAG: SLBB domain-containing protein [Planctomyces sp.]|nr:SLBB domain-containing protein [Planctomyces sp.]
MPASRTQRSAPANFVRLALLLLAGLSGGCASTKIYSVSTLPREWHAAPITNTRTLDLTKLASATVPESRIARGDVLDITVAAGSGRDDILTMPARVNDDGTVDVLHVGPVPVEDLELVEAEAAILRACVQQQIYVSPLVTVTLKRPKVNRVTVLGAVEKPQTVELRSGNSDLLQAIVQAGGLTEDAGTMVEVTHPGFREGSRRGTPPIAAGEELDGNQLASHEQPTGEFRPRAFRVDLASLSQESRDRLELPDGSVVMVEKRDPPALQVIGLVQKPNRYEFPVGKNLRLLDAISLASGTSNALADKVYVIRRRERGEPMLVEGSIRKAKRNGAENLLLEPGDTVSVEQTPGTVFLEAVRSVGVNVGGALF